MQNLLFSSPSRWAVHKEKIIYEEFSFRGKKTNPKINELKKKREKKNEYTCLHRIPYGTFLYIHIHYIYIIFTHTHFTFKSRLEVH